MYIIAFGYAVTMELETTDHALWHRLPETVMLNMNILFVKSKKK